MKRCPRCERDLPIEAFGRDKYPHDGHNKYCKECINAYNIAYRAKKQNVCKTPNGNILHLAEVANLLFSSPDIIMHKFRAGEFPFDGVDNSGRLYWEHETIRKFILKRIEERKSA
jgi:hypothetical protein